jgi:hypothetical protein
MDGGQPRASAIRGNEAGEQAVGLVGAIDADMILWLR